MAGAAMYREIVSERESERVAAQRQEQAEIEAKRRQEASVQRKRAEQERQTGEREQREQTKIQEMLAYETKTWTQDAKNWLDRQARELGADDTPEILHWRQKLPGLIQTACARWTEAKTLDEAKRLVHDAREEWEQSKEVILNSLRWIQINWRSDQSVIRHRVEAGKGHWVAGIFVEVENHGYQEVNVNPFYLSVIADGVEYTQTFAVLDPKLQSVRLMNGARTSGGIAFEIPTNAKKIELRFEPPLSTVNVKYHLLEK